MRFNFGKIACSLVLCSCLLGCSQVKEAVCSALDDDNEEVAVTQCDDSGVCCGAENLPADISEGGCPVGNASEYADEVAGSMNDSTADPVMYGANTGGNKFSLVDPGTNMTVETYQLPAGWQGTGRVLRPAKKSITWQSIFVHPQVGSAGFRNYSTSYDGVGPFRNSPIFQNGNLALGLLNDLSQYLNMQNIQVTSADFAPHDTPENRQTIQLARSKIAPGLQINFVPLQYHAKVTMTCNGQPYKADLVSNLLCWEYNAGRVMMHGICVQDSHGIVAPAAKMPQEQKAMLAILSSRWDDKQWKQYSEQSAIQQSQQLGEHYDRMNQIVQDKNAYISNIQNEMNQNNAATQDRVRKGWNEAITERTDVANPLNPGTTVTTDNNYNRAWTNSEGNVINTDSELYNPGVDWTQVK